MRNLSSIGRVFYGISITVIGILTICYHDFPYMMVPPNHSGIPGFVILTYIFGAMFVLAGACIVLKKKIRSISLALGTVLLLVFCFYFIPYEFLVSPNYMHFGDWENSAKELALAGGAFVIADCFSEKNGNKLTRFLNKLAPFGAIIFSITILSFSIDHFLFADAAKDYVPSWIPYHLFWMYFAGIALLGSGIAIILKIKTSLFAFLLGAMIFTWFIILHMPRVIVSPVADLGDEISSAILALTYSGIAFVISGVAKNKEKNLVSQFATKNSI
ncbi:MAG TPA: hypothetical protein VK787_10255 [Puia sp.]|jgi:uncharacterized membrane protein|nr:hypothetical protein [Puia sp.]